MARPISAMRRWTRTVSAGRRGPKEKNTCPPAPGARAETARDRNSRAPGTVDGGAVTGTVEQAEQRAGQRVAEVMLDQLGGEAERAQLAAQVADQVAVAVDHRDPARPRGGADVPGERGQGHADQVVVAQQQ